MLPRWAERQIEHHVTADARFTTKHNSYPHAAFLFQGRKMIAVGQNRVSYRRRSSAGTIHAEADVIRSLGDTQRLRGATLIVVRIGGHGDLVNSKPCAACQRLLEKCQRQYGLHAFYHS
jgi:hypothetical protein